jgi:hypothetical protein
MADAVSPPAALVAASAPVAAIPLIAASSFLTEIGMDPARMVAGLFGVVIVQTLLPRTATGWRSITALAAGSMLFASFASPIAYVWAMKLMPSDWDWLRQVEAVHMKAVCAGMIGGFAQPILMLVKGAAAKYLPAPKEPTS